MIIQENILILLLYFRSSAIIIKCEKVAYQQTDNRQQVIRICLKENLEYRVPKEFFIIKQIPKIEKFKKKKMKLQRIFGWYVSPSLTFLTFGFRSPFYFSVSDVGVVCLKIYIITCISLCLQEKFRN